MRRQASDAVTERESRLKLQSINVSELVGRCSGNSNCVRKQVGAAILRGETLISTGCNGVAHFTDCRDAGCKWCTSDGPAGMGYDRCICTHAEQAAIGDAVRRGLSTDGAMMYISLRPCMNCVKLALTCGIDQVYYEEQWVYKDLELEEAYAILAGNFSVFKWVNAGIPPL